METIDGATFMAEAMTEKQLSDQIVQLARKLGWLVHRDPTWRSTGTDPGYPDLTLIRAGRVVFAELKAEKGKQTASQMEWAGVISATTEGIRDTIHAAHTGACPGRCGERAAHHVYSYVWRPSDWYAGAVERVLK